VKKKKQVLSAEERLTKEELDALKVLDDSAKVAEDARAAREVKERDLLDSMQDAQQGYLILIRVHDRIWNSRDKLSLSERVECCRIIWGLQLELRDPLDMGLFGDPDPEDTI
jgi:hypothetical protein